MIESFFFGPNEIFCLYIYRYIVNERSDGIKPRAEAARTLPRMRTPSMLNCWVEILSMMKDVGWVDIRKQAWTWECKF